ncbi:hypothetical protein ACLB2K_016332 [Fragaria x ananassa]
MPVPVALARCSPAVPQLRPPIALPSPNTTWEQQPGVSIIYNDTRHTPLGGIRSVPSLAWGLGGLGIGYVATSIGGSKAGAPGLPSDAILSLIDRLGKLEDNSCIWVIPPQRSR